MPQRPPAHQTEDLSRAAFRLAIPPEWVVQDLQPDYGLDAHVELVDPSGDVLGLAFYVQFKGTETSDLDVWFPIEQWEHFRRRDLPVLVVRFHRPSMQLYCRWAHSFHPELRLQSASRDRAGTKGVTLGFSEPDRWTNASGGEIRTAVAAVRGVRDDLLSVPITLTIEAGDEASTGLADELLLALQTETLDNRHLVRISDQRLLPHDPVVVLTDEGTRVDVAGLASVTLAPALRPISTHYVADVIIAVARNYALLGRDEISARLSGSFFHRGLVMTSAESGFLLAGSFARSARVSEALQLAERLERRQDETRMAAVPFELAVLSIQGQLSTSQLEEVEDHHRRSIARAKQKDGRSLASARYSFGNFLRSQRRWSEALEQYDGAALSDPTYTRRDYWQVERAGAFFESGRFSEAADAYAKGLELGANLRVYALLADSLLLAGRYAEAEQAFDLHPCSCSPRDAEWRLKRQMIPLLREVAGDTQARRPEEADQLAALKSIQGAIEPGARLQEALKLDALCALAWFNLGVDRKQPDEAADGGREFLMAAIINRSDPEAWANAWWLLSASLKLPRDIFFTAYRFDGSTFLKCIWENPITNAPGFPGGPFTQLLNGLIDEAEPGPEPAVLARWANPDGTYESIRFGTGGRPLE